MKFFRSVLVTLSFGLFGIGSCILNFLLFPLVKKMSNEKDFIYFSSKIIRLNWKIFIKILKIIGLIRVNIKNPEKIKDINNMVIVSTHPSFIDILILMSIIPNSTCFVKEALSKNFILKNIVNSIFIPNNVDIETLKKESKKYLNLGFNLIVFPMGFRHRHNEHPKIKKGASLIAINANKDILPIKITESEDFLFINQPFYEGGRKTVNFDIEIKNPIKISDYYDESEIVMKRKITKEIENVLYN